MSNTDLGLVALAVVLALAALLLIVQAYAPKEER